MKVECQMIWWWQSQNALTKTNKREYYSQCENNNIYIQLTYRETYKNKEYAKNKNNKEDLQNLLQQLSLNPVALQWKIIFIFKFFLNLRARTFLFCDQLWCAYSSFLWSYLAIIHRLFLLDFLRFFLFLANAFHPFF